MPVSLSIKHVPDDLAECLRRRAARNHRSLQRELLSILEGAAGLGTSTAANGPAGSRQDPISVDDLAAISRSLFPEETDSSVGFIRQLRDSR